MDSVIKKIYIESHTHFSALTSASFHSGQITSLGLLSVALCAIEAALKEEKKKLLLETLESTELKLVTTT